VKAQIAHFFRVFDREITVLARTSICGCDACSSVDQLKLKQIVHIGPVAIERIDRFDKLIGFDVIVAHRLLKNSVPADEYVLLTMPAFEILTAFSALESEQHSERLEGNGDIDVRVIDKRHLLREK
jgi:hypothetical protein